ncbi:MAG TPA: fibronectin type III domain-containing protein [bacterium]|nr:fibronectin type III domain-containing protein [bacterium]
MTEKRAAGERTRRTSIKKLRAACFTRLLTVLVAAVFVAGCGGGTSTTYAVATSAPPAVAINAPEILSSTSARLSWSMSASPKFHSYKLRRSTSPGVTESSTLVAAISGAAQTSRDISGLSSAATYYFKVYVCDSAGLCSGSAEVSVRTSERLTALQTVDANAEGAFQNGCFCRVFHRSSTNRFVVTFSSGLAEDPYNAYKEYGAGFGAPVASGAFRTVFGGDYAAAMVADYYYLLTGGPGGWLLIKYDPAWNEVASVSVPVDLPVEKNNDQMLAYVNGLLVASSLHHDPDEPSDFEGTHHRFYTTNLVYQGKRILKDVRHVNGSSMLFADGAYHLFSSESWHGQLLSLSYDSNWNFIGSRELTSDGGRWPQGALRIGDIYYVAYVTDAANPPAGIKLAALDSDWNLLETVRVFDDPDFLTASDRPWLFHKDGVLYVSYDVATFSDPGRVENRDWTCHIKSYRINY